MAFKLIELLSKRERVRKFLLNFNNSFKDPKSYYLYCELFLKNYSDKALLKHRMYYLENRRSFGEDAFTVMWFLLYNQFKFKNFLEIGVYRGQTLSLLTLLATLNEEQIDAVGISPLTAAGDTVSIYPEIDYNQDIRTNFNYFNLNPPKLVKAFSTEKAAIEEISSRKWDCVYIDGNHDYEIVKADFNNVLPFVRKGGLIVFDDASLNLGASNFYGGFPGHPGPSDFIDTIPLGFLREVLRVGHNRCFQKL